MSFSAVGQCIRCGSYTCNGFMCMPLKGLGEPQETHTTIFGDMLTKEIRKRDEIIKMDAEIKALENEIEYETKVRQIKILRERLKELKRQ